jgi:hypothetical protein
MLYIRLSQGLLNCNYATYYNLLLSIMKDSFCLMRIVWYNISIYCILCLYIKITY